MFTDTIRTYYDYAEWANGRVLDAAERLTPEQFLETDLDNVWSIRDTLVHIMWAHWIWLERWHGVFPRTEFDPQEYPDPASIRARWNEINQKTRRFVETLTDDRLAEPLTYTNLVGQDWTYPLWEQMLHQSNHATYHRGEVAALLSRFGASPGELDFLLMLDAQRVG
jgi:uncharacterized damage-inducible protein DinB